MKARVLSLGIIALFISVSLFGTAYGHGLGEDQATPVGVGDKLITVNGKIDPADFPIDPSKKPTFFIRAHDENNDVPVGGIDYRIVVELRNDTLLDQRFRSADGVVLANLIPDYNTDGWKITDHESASPEDRIDVTEASPVELRSRILSSGGLYHIKVTIERSSTGLALQNDLNFDLFISVAHEFSFSAETAQGSRNFVLKTYYDDVAEFAYDNGTISFSMPFDWDPDYLKLVSVVHIEVRFPKDIELLRTNGYTATLNGAILPAASVQIDDYTSEEDRIVHFVMNGQQLSDIGRKIGDNTDDAVFTLTGNQKPRFPVDLYSAPKESYLFQLSWGPDVIETGIPIKFVMNLQDPVTGELIRGANFDFVVTQNGAEVYRQQMRSDFGTFAHDYTFSQAGIATLSASNINGQGESSSIDLVVLQGTTTPVPGPPEKPSGCLIATAAFGSELSPQVQFLRNFREHYILSTSAGSAFMNTFNSVYYSFSPQVADYEREQPWLQNTVKAGLYPLFGILMASEKAHFGVGGGEAGAIASGTVAGGLIGAVYLVPLGIPVANRVHAKWILIIIAASLAFLLSTLYGAQSLLPYSTALFVVAVASGGSLVAAKLIRRVFRK